MLDEILVSRVIGVAGLLPGVLLVALFGWAVVARARGRAVGVWWRNVLAFAAGAHVGFGLLITGAAPVLQAAALLLALVIGLWLLWTGRRAAAGWFALAVALPWTLLWGYFVLLLVLGANFEPYTTVVTFLLGAVPVAIALAVVVAGDPPPPEPRPDAAPGQPGSRRIGNLSAALRGSMSVGPVTTMELAGLLTIVGVTIVTANLPVPWLAQAVVAIVVGTLVGTEVALRAAPSRVRQALEAFSWLGEWELERARQIGIPRPIGSVREAERWLAITPERPEDRWFRWEALVLTGRLDEAEQVAARMPDRTPYERFEQTYALNRIRWARGAPGDGATLQAAAEAVGPADDLERRRADVAVAIAESQELASAGLDPLPPLVGARAELPPDVRLGRLYVDGMRRALLLAALILAVAVRAPELVADALVTLLR